MNFELTPLDVQKLREWGIEGEPSPREELLIAELSITRRRLYESVCRHGEEMNNSRMWHRKAGELRRELADRTIERNWMIGVSAGLLLVAAVLFTELMRAMQP